MKRILLIALASVPLAFGTASCEKAHKAGNDSMRLPGGQIVATGG
ncbi:hypothetical protein AAGS40_16640 [Paraburkholderia sp. PREW-6R]